MEDLKIKITLAFLEEGTRKDASRCPIALACMDQGLQDVEVDGDTINATIDVCKETWTLPKEAQRFVELFDAEDGAAVPFEFVAVYKESLYFE